MKTAKSCRKNLTVDIGNEVFKPIRFGYAERDIPFPKRPKDLPPYEERCHDCGVIAGGIHHPGCDWEECPKCRRQLISCGCLDEQEKK